MLEEVDWVFYDVYSSKYNRETIQTLKHEFSLPQFLIHKEFIHIKEAVDMAANLDEKNELDKISSKNKSRRK